MSDEFREEIKGVIRRHDPTAEELRTLAAYLNTRADRYDALEDDEL